jgi:hypothetical protein
VNFNAFVCLVVLLRDAAALEVISYVNRKGISRYLQDIPHDKPEVVKAVIVLLEFFMLNTFLEDKIATNPYFK